MQFLDKFTAASTSGINQMIYSSLPAEDNKKNELPSLAWKDTLEQIIDDTTMDFVIKCIENEVPEPSSVGFELVDDGGKVIAEAELVWENDKIALLTPQQVESEEIFLNKGWRIIKTDDALTHPLFWAGRSAQGELPSHAIREVE